MPTQLCHMVWAEVFPFRRWISGANRKTVRADFFAGLTGAVVVLPQGVAFATIAGLPPQYGLYTAMVPVIIAALFGSSHHLISGPTTAISLVVFSTLAGQADPGSPEYIALCLTLTFLAGLTQLAMGLARMGTLVNFVSHSVVVGFTAGAAILIAGSQLKHFLGLTLPSGLSFPQTLLALWRGLPETNPSVLGVGALTLAVAVVLSRVAPRSPYMLIALTAGSLAAPLVTGPEGSIPLVGPLPASLPPLSSPMWDADVWKQLASGAFAIALLGLIEAVSIARSVALQTKQPINGNQEFIGQGLANLTGSFFSAYASSGSFTRSGINHRAGAQTPLAAIFSAGILTLIVLLAAPLAAYLPIASMAGVILLVAYNLIDFHEIKLISRTSRPEMLVMAGTFLATLLLELELAIYVGVLASLFYYLRDRATPGLTRLIPHPDGIRHLVTADRFPECPQVRIVKVEGSLFFGSVNHVAETLRCFDRQEPRATHLILVGTTINSIDVAGVEMLGQEALRRRARGGGLYLFDVHETVRTVMVRGGILDFIGEKNLFNSVFEAMHHVTILRLDHDTCRKCDRSVFLECAQVRCIFPESKPGSVEDLACGRRCAPIE